jgi:CheY-like chemotaxis protein
MGPQPSLLLVEDNEDDVFLMARALNSASFGCMPQTVADGRLALDYLAGTGSYADRQAYPLPALIFLDIKLPRISGLEVLRWLRAQPDLRQIVVIVLTSSNHPGDIRQAYDLGANSYVVKPASYQELVEFARACKEYWLGWNRPTGYGELSPPERQQVRSASSEI